MDWPLSRNEKKQQLLRLYNGDVQAADSMLSSGDKALEALREELEAVRRAAGVQKAQPCEAKLEAAEEVERLRAAVESAAAVLRAIVPPQEDSPPTTPREVSCGRFRARSEGASREPSVPALRPALCQTPRSNRPKRKVSFGGQPEEEPNHVPAEAASDEEGPSVILSTPPKRKHRDSLGMYKERSSNAYPVDDVKGDESQGVKGSSSCKLHFGWLLCSLLSAACLAHFAYKMGSSKAPPSQAAPVFGDPACWVQGFRPDYCCLGLGGNPSCWDEVHTYERCCLPKHDL